MDTIQPCLLVALDLHHLRVMNRDLHGAELERIDLSAHKVQPNGRRLRAAERLNVLINAGFVIHREEELSVNLYYVNRDNNIIELLRFFNTHKQEPSDKFRAVIALS